jgi:hypothetical protein
MKLRSLKSLFLALFGTVCFLGLNFALCGPTGPSEPAPSTTTLDELILQSQAVSGWTRIVDSWKPSDTLYRFDQSTMNNLVDGGNVSYCNSCNGKDSPMKNGVHYSMKDSLKQTSIDIFTIDYGTVSGATAEFNSRTGNGSLNGKTKISLPSFSESEILVEELSGGAMAFGHFAQYYFELVFDGYNPSSTAGPDASAFMTLFKSRVK